MKVNFYLFMCAVIFIVFSSCDSRPKVIESQSSTDGLENHDHDAHSASPTLNVDEHEVRVDEILQATKYSYLSVSENEEKYWIAIPRSEVKEGDIYVYKGGLLKKNFKSQEFDRVFETVYLVSNFWKKTPGDESPVSNGSAHTKIEPLTSPDIEVGNIAIQEGSILLSELISNKEKYNGKLVQVTGKCVKVNPMIMGKNWVHLQDGSGEEFDLTVTTTEVVVLGSVVTLEGSIVLDKDFGAGYRYEILMEGAKLKK